MSTRRTRRPAQRTDPAGGGVSTTTLATVTPHATQAKAAPKRSTKPKALVKAVDGTERDVLVRCGASWPTASTPATCLTTRSVSWCVSSGTSTARFE
jgi:hypothetical protein